MIKNKTLLIKINFKTYLKILKTGQKHFRLLSKLLLYKNHKTIFKKYYQKIFFGIIF